MFLVLLAMCFGMVSPDGAQSVSGSPQPSDIPSFAPLHFDCAMREVRNNVLCEFFFCYGTIFIATCILFKDRVSIHMLVEKYFVELFSNVQLMAAKPNAELIISESFDFLRLPTQ